MNRYINSPSYRKAKNKILTDLIGTFILFGISFSIVLAGIGFTLASIAVFVLCIVAYVATRVWLEG